MLLSIEELGIEGLGVSTLRAPTIQLSGKAMETQKPQAPHKSGLQPSRRRFNDLQKATNL